MSLHSATHSTRGGACYYWMDGLSSIVIVFSICPSLCACMLAYERRHSTLGPTCRRLRVISWKKISIALINTKSGCVPSWAVKVRLYGAQSVEEKSRARCEKNSTGCQLFCPVNFPPTEGIVVPVSAGSADDRWLVWRLPSIDVKNVQIKIKKRKKTWQKFKKRL